MLVLRFHGSEDGVTLQIGGGTSVIPLTEATLTMSVVGDGTMIIGQPTDDGA